MQIQGNLGVVSGNIQRKVCKQRGSCWSVFENRAWERSFAVVGFDWLELYLLPYNPEVLLMQEASDEGCRQRGAWGQLSPLEEILET